VLAERERRRLCEKARLAELLEGQHERLRAEGRDVAVVDVDALRRAVEHDLGRWDEADRPTVVRAFVRRKLLPAGLMGSLLVNGILAAEFVVHADSQRAALGVPAAEHPTTVEPVSSKGVTPTGAEPVSRATVTSPLPRRSVVERKLISLIIAAPARKLPRAFVDPVTGLVRNNVHVTCRKARSHSYRCAIQLPGKQRGSLIVSYRFGHGGKGVFTWYGYRQNKGTKRFLQNRRPVRAEKTK
jgi:hypothetical protein